MGKKKGQQKKKVVHAFNKKEWYNIRAPALFEVRVPTLTPCNKAQGQNIPADSLRGRIFQITHADLNQQNKHDLAWRIIKLQVEEVKGYDCFTNFNGLSITRDKTHSRQEVALPYRGLRPGQDQRWLPCPSLRHCLHQKTKQTGQGYLLRQGLQEEDDPPKDAGDYDERVLKVHPQGTLQKAPHRPNRHPDHPRVQQNLPSPERPRTQGQGPQET